MIDGQKTPHHAVLKDYQQHPVRGTITHVDFHEVRLDQPIQATVLVQLRRRVARARRSAVSSSRSRASSTSRRCRPTSRSTSRSISAASSSARASGCRMSRGRGCDLPRRPRRHRDRQLLEPARPDRGRRGRRRGARRRGLRRVCRRGGACAPRQTRSNPCPSSVGASRPRRSTCSSSGSGTRAGEHERDRHNLGFMVVDELARRHEGVVQGEVQRPLAEVRIDGRRLALLKPGHVHERLRPLGAARGGVLQDTARDACSSSTTRSTSTSAGSRPASAAASPATTASARSRGGSAAPTSSGSASVSGVPGAAIRVPSPTSCWRRSRPRTTRRRSSPVPTPSSRSSRRSRGDAAPLQLSRLGPAVTQRAGGASRRPCGNLSADRGAQPVARPGACLRGTGVPRGRWGHRPGGRYDRPAGPVPRRLHGPDTPSRLHRGARRERPVPGVHEVPARACACLGAGAAARARGAARGARARAC